MGERANGRPPAKMARGVKKVSAAVAVAAVPEPDVEGLSDRERLDAYAAAGYCGGKVRSGDGYCTRPAGWGTDHVGDGRCKMHGGATPVLHGRYTKVARERIADLYAEMAEDPDPLNLLPELAMLRALAVDYVNRYDDYVEALTLWWAAHSAKRAKDPAVRAAAQLVLDEGAPRQHLDMREAAHIVSDVTKAAKRIEDIRAQNAISRADLYRLLREMGRAVRKRNSIADPDERLARIEADWDAMVL